MQQKKTSYFARLKEEDPEHFRAIAARGGLARAAKHGRDTNLVKARAAHRASRIAYVDPQGILSPEELAIRLHDLDRVQAMRMREGKRRKQLAREAADRDGAS